MTRDQDEDTVAYLIQLKQGGIYLTHCELAFAIDIKDIALARHYRFAGKKWECDLWMLMKAVKAAKNKGKELDKKLLADIQLLRDKFEERKKAHAVKLTEVTEEQKADNRIEAVKYGLEICE